MKRLVLFTFVLLLAVPATAQAQSAFEAKSPAFYNNFAKQVTLNLKSPVEQVRMETLQHVIFFATFHQDAINFTESVGPILDIFERENDEGYRILALAALHAVGNNSAMQYLAEQVGQERSERVRRMMSTVVSAHYNQAGLALRSN